MEEISKKLDYIINLLEKQVRPELIYNSQAFEFETPDERVKPIELEEHTAYEMYQRKKRWKKDSFLSSGGYGGDYPYYTMHSKPKAAIPHAKEGEPIVKFRGAKITRTEANILGRLENFSGKEFFYNNTDSFTSQMNFRVIKNRVIELGLYGEGILDLPQYIDGLEALQIIVLSKNFLIDLPETIGNLKYLEELYLDQNKLFTLPDSIGNLNSLTYLNIDVNSLEVLPDSISNLKNLEIFRCNKNKLDTLPDSIGLLKNLRELCLNDNHMNNLPESLYNLSQLEVLDLNNNRLESISDKIEHLISLESLNLVGNRLKTLPLTIQKLTKLQYLWIKKNPLDLSENSAVNKISEFLMKKGTRL